MCGNNNNNAAGLPSSRWVVLGRDIAYFAVPSCSLIAAEHRTELGLLRDSYVKYESIYSRRVQPIATVGSLPSLCCVDTGSTTHIPVV